MTSSYVGVEAVVVVRRYKFEVLPLPLVDYYIVKGRKFTLSLLLFVWFSYMFEITSLIPRWKWYYRVEGDYH